MGRARFGDQPGRGDALKAFSQGVGCCSVEHRDWRRSVSAGACAGSSWSGSESASSAGWSAYDDHNDTRSARCADPTVGAGDAAATASSRCS